MLQVFLFLKTFKTTLLFPPLASVEYLDQFEASPAPNESKIQPQRLFKEPVRIIEKYPVGQEGDLTKKYMVCINWLLAEEPLNVETELALGFLDHLLLGTPASPLRRILLESGLGDAIVGGGVEDELLQPQFSIGLKGVSEDNIKKVEELVMQTLKNLAEEGFASEAVEASMNTIEFALRENNTGSFPRGLSLMLRSIVRTTSHNLHLNTKTCVELIMYCLQCYTNCRANGYMIWTLLSL
jgi:presequence protease